MISARAPVASQRRARRPPRHPRQRPLSRPHTVPGPCDFPRPTRAQRRLVFPTRRTRALRTVRTVGPSRGSPVCAPTEVAAVPRRYLRRHHDVTGEPPLFKAAPSSPSRLLPPLHCARHGRRLKQAPVPEPFVAGQHTQLLPYLAREL
jgi:hypothetical protein